MTESEINTNILIAEYLGYTKYMEGTQAWWKLPDQMYCLHKQAINFEYHNSWDAMEPAIIKAGSTAYNIFADREMYEIWKDIQDGLQRLDKSKVHKALGRFIHCHNRRMLKK